MAARGASPSAAGPSNNEGVDPVNARVISRKDPFFTEIIDNAGIATLYNYVPSLNQYVKQPAVGPLFLIRR